VKSGDSEGVGLDVALDVGEHPNRIWMALKSALAERVDEL
jgi:hypothetical protein